MAHHEHGMPAPIEQRVSALESALDQQGMKPGEFIDDFAQVVAEQWVPRNGARVVAKAWTDPAFRRRLLENGRDAVAELGLTMPAHHRHLVVLENTSTLHNVIVCTQCSCTAFSTPEARDIGGTLVRTSTSIELKGSCE
jgi:nitrile hydratase